MGFRLTSILQFCVLIKLSVNKLVGAQNEYTIEPMFNIPNFNCQRVGLKYILIKLVLVRQNK